MRTFPDMGKWGDGHGARGGEGEGAGSEEEEEEEEMEEEKEEGGRVIAALHLIGGGLRCRGNGGAAAAAHFGLFLLH